MHINWKLRYSYNHQRVRGRKFVPLLQFPCFWYALLEVSAQQEGPSEPNPLVLRELGR